VTGIEEGRIELDLPQEAAHELPEYKRPTQSEELRP
jgi:hypothetical protein